MKRNVFSIHLAAFLFGMTGILSSLIDADSDVITFGRALFAVMVLSPILLVLGAPKGSPDRDTGHSPNAGEDPGNRATSAAPSLTNSKVWVRCLGSGFLLAIHWITFFISVKTAGVALATLGFSSFAAFITLLEWVTARHQVTRADWIRTLVVSAGLALMTPSLDLADTNTYGFAMGLLSGLSFAAMAVFNSRLLVGVNPIRVARNQNVIVLLLVGFWALPGMLALSALSWFWLALLGIFCTGLSHSLFVFSLSRMRVNVAGLVIALEPVYAIVAAWILFQEMPALRTIIGGIVIVSAIIGVNYAKTRQTNIP
ncbi:MAG: DMT family transporter [Orrella sp.]